MMEPQATAARYFEAMKSRDIELVVSLFSEAASLNLPDGRELVGVDAIRQWFSALFRGPAPSPTPGVYLSAARAIAVEIQTTLADGSLRRTANFFQLDDAGRIERLTSYARS